MQRTDSSIEKRSAAAAFFPVKAAADSTYVFLHLFSLTISLADFGQEVLKYDPQLYYLVTS